jgi:hypothetical protein
LRRGRGGSAMAMRRAPRLRAGAAQRSTHAPTQECVMPAHHGRPLPRAVQL